MTSVALQQAGANFLESQGDVWDAQKDMLMDKLGAIAAVGFFLIVRHRWGLLAARRGRRRERRGPIDGGEIETVTIVVASSRHIF